MNPYVYSRSKKAHQASAGALFKSIIHASLSPAVAFAVVIFAAGSVASISALAFMEMTQAVAAPLPAPVAYRMADSQVLGDSTTTPVEAIIQDSQLEAGAVAGKISAKPLSFDATLGRWDYTIFYSLPNFTGTATLSIGTYQIAQDITASGSTTTGSILKPSTSYNVTLWLTDQSGNQTGSIRYQLKTAKAKKSSTSSGSTASGLQCSLPQTPPSLGASSTPPSTPNFCIKKDDGSSQCAPVSCMPPMRRPMFGNSNGRSSSTPTTWSTSTPPHEHSGDIMPNPNASGTPPNLPPPQ